MERRQGKADAARVPEIGMFPIQHYFNNVYEVFKGTSWELYPEEISFKKSPKDVTSVSSPTSIPDRKSAGP
jgi:hypothetical protein